MGFASQLANWARPIDGDFQIDVDELRRAIPRMQRAGTKFIRCMSYPNREENPLPDDEWGDEVIRRFQILAQQARTWATRAGLAYLPRTDESTVIMNVIEK